MIERHDLFDPDVLLDYLLRVNEMLSQREMHMWELMIGEEEGAYVRNNPVVVCRAAADLVHLLMSGPVPPAPFDISIEGGYFRGLIALDV